MEESMALTRLGMKAIELTGGDLVKQTLVKLIRVSPAMVVAMLALFVALTGTAVATTSALITGIQVKNNSLTGADVKNKSLRPIDFRGSVRGPRGLRGVAGPQGAAGTQGVQGIQGAPGPFPDGDLPTGKTIRGTYALGAGSTDSFAWGHISFGFVLASAPAPHWIAAGANPPAECPGTVANPQAQAGHLCVYEDAGGFGNVGPRWIFSPTLPGGPQDQTSRYGAGLFMTRGAAASDFWSYGSWAVTAGAGVAAAAAPVTGPTP